MMASQLAGKPPKRPHPCRRQLAQLLAEVVLKAAALRGVALGCPRAGRVRAAVIRSSPPSASAPGLRTRLHELAYAEQNDRDRDEQRRNRGDGRIDLIAQRVEHALG